MDYSGIQKWERIKRGSHDGEETMSKWNLEVIVATIELQLIIQPCDCFPLYLN